MNLTRAGVVLVLPLSIALFDAEAATRLTYEIDGTPQSIQWNGEPIGIGVDQAVFGDSAAQASIARSFAAWEQIERGNVRFDRSAVGAHKPGSDGTSVITAVDELFSDSGFLAFTTAWFDDDGTIREADIQIDRAMAKKALEPLLTHELGHLLGLDHSGVISSAMFPFVDRDRDLALVQDDRIAIRQIYPGSSTKPAGAWLEGAVQNSHTPLWGVQIVAIDSDGRVHSTALTDRDGRYLLGPVDEGTYELYAEPLDGPVTRRNLSGLWFKIPEQVFTTTFASGQPVQLREGERRTVDFRVNEGPVTLNPKWIGTFDPSAGELSLDSMAVVARAGERVNLVVGGDGFISGMTTFEFPSDKVRRVSDFSWGSSYVWATFEIDEDLPASALAIIVKSGSETAALTGGLLVKETADQTRRRGAGRG